VTAWVGFSGGFAGVLTATFSEPLARALTRILMQQSFAESSREDVCDTIGELVNIVAGNLKGLLPAGCQLSLPHAEFGQHPQLREVEMSLGRAELRLFGEPVCMELSASPGLNPSQ
jgi:chemotaxis protein CheX